MDPQTTYPLPAQSSRRNMVLIVLSSLLILVILLAGWAFKSRQDYKRLSDGNKLSVSSSTQKAAQLQARLDQANKAPYKTYASSTTNGSVSFNYPKNWSAYVDDTSSSQSLNGYFYPDVVPSIQGNTAFALRVELAAGSYSDAVGQYDNEIQSGTVNAAAYIPPQMKDKPNVQPGLKLDGTINSSNSTKGSLVVMRVRDKTLKIYTQAPDFVGDFNDIILPSLSFAP